MSPDRILQRLGDREDLGRLLKTDGLGTGGLAALVAKPVACCKVCRTLTHRIGRYRGRLVIICETCQRLYEKYKMPREAETAPPVVMVAPRPEPKPELPDFTLDRAFYLDKSLYWLSWLQRDYYTPRTNPPVRSVCGWWSPDHWQVEGRRVICACVAARTAVLAKSAVRSDWEVQDRDWRFCQRKNRDWCPPDVVFPITEAWQKQRFKALKEAHQ
jgi:hypothetical protein